MHVRWYLLRAKTKRNEKPHSISTTWLRREDTVPWDGQISAAVRSALRFTPGDGFPSIYVDLSAWIFPLGFTSSLWRVSWSIVRTTPSRSGDTFIIHGCEPISWLIAVFCTYGCPLLPWCQPLVSRRRIAVDIPLTSSLHSGIPESGAILKSCSLHIFLSVRPSGGHGLNQPV